MNSFSLRQECSSLAAVPQHVCQVGGDRRTSSLTHPWAVEGAGVEGSVEQLQDGPGEHAGGAGGEGVEELEAEVEAIDFDDSCDTAQSPDQAVDILQGLRSAHYLSVPGTDDINYFSKQA